jgi:hypothetical protein
MHHISNQLNFYPAQGESIACEWSSPAFAHENRIPSSRNEELIRKLLDLEEKIKILENRVVGAGVQMGNIMFQSF